MFTRVALLALAATTLTLAACGNDDDDGCDLETGGGCDGAAICESIDGAPTCVAPIYLEGRVYDAATDSGIPDARVIAVDANGAARSAVAITDADGVYAVSVRADRDDDGTPLAASVTLRVDAEDYQPFPSPPRVGLPIDLTSGTSDDDATHIDNALTDVGLIANDGGGSTIEGHITGADVGGALVVAVRGVRAVSSALADLNGDFVLYNVPDAEVTVEAYRQGVRVDPETLSVARADDEVYEVTLASHRDGLGSVTGQVNIVNAPGGSTTSVILALASTFDASRAQGTAPPGLRAADVNGAFEILDVPPGDYVVLAAFENDDLVRDPDEGIGGTEIVEVTVGNGEDVTLDTSFKVTEALEVFGPGADGLDTVATLPFFEWADDSSEDGYELRVYDAFGDIIYEDLNVPGVSGDSRVLVSWPDAELEVGMVYQFRAWSFRDRTGGRTYISATEDLRGTFIYAP